MRARPTLVATFVVATLVAGCSTSSSGPAGPASPSGPPGSLAPGVGSTASAPAPAAPAPATPMPTDASSPPAAGGTATLPPGDPIPDAFTGRYDSLTDQFVKLDLLPSGDAYLSPGGVVVVHDRFSIAGDTIAFAGESCDGQLGTYRWSSDAGTLSLRRIEDPCRARSVAIVQAFRRAADQLPYAPATRSPISWTQPDYNLATVDAKGDFFMTDGGSGFYAYRPDGSTLGSWTGDLSYATGITVVPSGDIYVSDFDQAKVRRFDPSGKLLDSFTVGDGVIGPVGLAHDAAGDIYVALHREHAHHLEKHSPDGKLLASWAPEGSGKGEIGAGSASGPENLAVGRDGSVYVTDPVNQRIVEYDADGGFLRAFTGTADAPLESGDVAVDSKGNVYTLVDQAIWRFDPSGKPTGRWFVNYPGALVVDASDRIFVVGTVIAEVTLPAG
jgi:sugar lactone lactonase YvrE